MPTIQLKDMTFYYDKYYKNVFTEVNLSMDTSWRLGLVGRNGRGKSTLLKLLNEQLTPSKGDISIPVNTEYFPYDYKKNFTKTIDVVKENIAPYHDLEKEMEDCISMGDEESLNHYGDLLEEYESIDGFIIDFLIEKEFRLISLDIELLDKEFQLLSGGEKTKSLLVALFLRKNNFLLIDEPTNHLDISGREKVSEYLSQKSGFIVVSHDRTFLDRCIDHVLSINKESIYIEKGNFSSWEYNKNLKDQYELNTKKKLERKVKILEVAAKKGRRWSNDKEKEKIGCRGDKGAIGARAAKLMKRAINIESRTNRMLDETKNLLKNYETVKELELNQQQLEDDVYIDIKDLCFSYDDRTLINKISFNIQKGDRLWIKGANGCGKSTLLKLICGELEYKEGEINIKEDLQIGRGHQETQELKGFLDDILKEYNMNLEKFKHILSYFDLDKEYFERPIETFSQGEKKKIDIAMSFSKDNHVFIWDEPLNYMDIFFRKQIEEAILEFEPTIIFVEHDETFGKKIANKVISFYN